MKANSYQELAARTLSTENIDLSGFEIETLNYVVGLTGEAGEVAELFKKGFFHGQGIDIEKLKKELGDVLWYVAAISTRVGLSLAEIMQHNVDKLKARYPKGFDVDRSLFKEGLAE